MPAKTTTEHLRAKLGRCERELLEVEPRRLDGHVVECRLKRGARLAGDVVGKLVERVADGQQRSQLRDRKPGGLRSERGRARDAWVHLDQHELAPGYLPWKLVPFLDYAAEDLGFLQKVGGGYMFIHRYLLEHFAAMGEEGEEKSTTPAPAQRPSMSS